MNHITKALLAAVTIAGLFGGMLVALLVPSGTKLFYLSVGFGIMAPLCLVLGLIRIKLASIPFLYYALSCVVLLGYSIVVRDPPLTWSWKTLDFIITYGGLSAAIYAVFGIGGFLAGRLILRTTEIRNLVG